MWKHGLKYGKVADLFDQFTYNFARADTARPYSDLSNKTLKHRKEFIKNVLDVRTPPTPYPIEFDDPDAQLCASSFLEQNHTLFQHDPSNPNAQVRELRYPGSAVEIVNVLAKIMCTQEVMYHRNLSSAESRKAAKDDTIVAESPIPLGVGGVGVSGGGGGSGATGTDDGYQDERPSSSRRSARESKDEKDPKEMKDPKSDYSNFEKNILPENIKINLEASYPLDGRPDGTSSDWLFEPGNSWPEDLAPFVYRWLHEHHAYKLSGPEGEYLIHNFIEDLKRQVGLSVVLRADQQAKIYKKASKFLFSWVKTWSDCGLLIQVGDKVQRHRFLEEALNVRRSQYIATVLDGRPENGPGMRGWINFHGRGLKRHANVIDEELKPDVSEPLKRPKPDPDTAIHLLDDSGAGDGNRHQRRHFGPTPLQPRPSLSTPDPMEHHNSNPSVVAGVPAIFNGVHEPTPKSSISPTIPSFVTGITGPAKPATPTPSTADEIISYEQPAQSIPFRYVPSLPPGTNPRLPDIGSSKRHSLPPGRPNDHTPEPAVGATIENKPENRRVSAPYQGNGTRSEEPAAQTPAPTAPTNRPSATPDIKSSGPSLRLIIEQAEGSLNADNPLYEHDLRNSTLNEFFDKVTSRRQDPSLAVNRLRLIQRWGAKTFFVVDRSTGEDEWKRVRGDIRRNYAFQSERKPGKTRFEVYVICEDDSATSEDEDEY